ncbi:MAG: phosphate acyltransferase PlsX [Kyrpidia sp.]|nr:phosphate acyltransferase PlsX [Kyrpidia sp.]
MKIAIDAMGGDQGPAAAMEGVVAAARRYPDVNLVVIGREERVRPYLAGAPDNVSLVHAEEVIASDDEPVRAVRRKSRSSIVTAARMVQEGACDAMLSAGNTGALMTAGLLIVGRMQGVARPALAPILPTLRGKGVLVLDVGANMDPEPGHLWQYAVMGSLYAEKVLGIDRPAVGLLNVGTEAGKGNRLTKETYPLLSRSTLNFVGNVEARDVFAETCDVVVCDGFVGNVLLKTLEGVGMGIFVQLKELFTSTATAKLVGLLMHTGLEDFRRRMDYREYGGAPLLGLKGLLVKVHGSSNGRAFEVAIGQTRRFVAEGVTRLMQERLRESGFTVGSEDRAPNLCEEG